MRRDQQTSRSLAQSSLHGAVTESAMLEPIRNAVLHIPTGSHRGQGMAATAARGLLVVRRSRACQIECTVPRPYACFVLQGTKQVSMGAHTQLYRGGDTAIVPSSLPTITRTVEASHRAPYLALALEIDRSVVLDLATRLPPGNRRPVNTDAELKEAVLRLVRLLDRPASLEILQPGLVYEIHYWLLAGLHGPALRAACVPEGRAGRIADAIALLRSDFAKPLSVEQLAAAACMGRAAFHRHFRAITTLSPLQYQKRLRLTEARRQIFNGIPPGRAAAEVGYASMTQFSREYLRVFGLPPVRDRQSSLASLADAFSPMRATVAPA